MNLNRSLRRSSQSGVVLLEALIGILIFSLGILALVAMSTSAIRVQGDAQYRAEAMNLTEQISSAIWSGVGRQLVTTGGGTEISVVDTAALQLYQHAQGGELCSFNGSTSGQGTVTAWLARVQNMLPGSGNGMQQIVINTAANNEVRITVCWQAPSDNQVRHHTLVTYVN
ncbi:MAG TPA: hypothetical protein PKN13_05250 [Accumulibacter sp.]|nr:hypothetical protein [Accumulibacter sp.]HMW17642.1 hypothetical protein [Accumulibacter sp.]HMY06064.1 hypothetical protein [Accumulibacter sp.]HNC18425.1 hypothetical protein [Accumulibacter sp.]HND80001.1 hypothetical protein [Accumulibacter sp.]